MAPQVMWGRACLAPSHFSSPYLESFLARAPLKRQCLYSGNYGPPGLRACHWACPVPGHVMPVMAASVARGGVSAGFLLRAARGTWWSRPVGSWGSGEAAAPVTTRRFRATGTWGVLGDCVNPSDACEARRGRSPNRVFQARARRGKKKLAAPTGPGTCECRGSSPLFFIPRGSSGPHLALQPHRCVPSLPRPIPLAVKGRGTKPRRYLLTAPTIKFSICIPICPQGERGVRRPVRPADSGERQSGGQCAPPGPAPWSGPGRWEPAIGIWGGPYPLFLKPCKSDIVLRYLTLPWLPIKRG